MSYCMNTFFFCKLKVQVFASSLTRGNVNTPGAFITKQTG